MNISKTAALAASKDTVTRINPRGEGFVFFVDHDVMGLVSPSREVPASSYEMAVKLRSKWIAINALTLMGMLNAQTRAAIELRADDVYESHAVDALLQAGIDKFESMQ